MKNATTTTASGPRWTERALRRLAQLGFTLGDYCAGAVTGAATAVAVRAIVGPDSDMVIAMLLGSAAGMAVHLVVVLLAAPVLGMFNVMVPSSLIGMYGGMLFAMRDSMHAEPVSIGHAAGVGIVFGLVVVASVHAYDAVLRVGALANANPE